MVTFDPNQDRRDRTVEEPGDTNAADIVSRTGEEMPKQSHDGVDDHDGARPRADAVEDDEDHDGLPV